MLTKKVFKSVNEKPHDQSSGQEILR